MSKIDQLEGHHCCWYGGMFQEHRVTLKMLSPEGEAVQSRVSGVSTNCYANKSFDDCLEINLRSAYQPQAPQSSIILEELSHNRPEIGTRDREPHVLVVLDPHCGACSWFA